MSTSPQQFTQQWFAARNDAFNEVRSIAITTWCSGQWPDFGNRSKEYPRVHPWQVNEQNELFHPTDLSQDFAQCQIPDTYCICAMQELDPVNCLRHSLYIHVGSRRGQHQGKMVAGCRAQHEGCGLFIPLEILYSNHNLLMAKYPKREAPGIGIFRFNDHNEPLPLSPQATHISNSAGSSQQSSSVKCPHSESSSSPLKYCGVHVPQALLLRVSFYKHMNVTF
ncbi:hypothetical protein M422DRAFT_267135 [Sphaerobolus stellatus SS14]|uniref:Uncharacterized protein n=1 Tax=Sphaerobolus stellatus (strain SS14) TaxID=990650 RepID=A0A0C9V160_SPHS4|nr:hypothetical protein M422DRAFT_267135 [Sphaerobolus stellatus SS14]